MFYSLPDFPRAKILLVGDIMLDRYWLGPVGRISPEAPVPIVRVNKIDERLGGAANVALNIQSLGATCTLLGISGDDAAADTLEKELKNKNINYFLHRECSVPTITKLRVISRNQQLIRLDFEEISHSLPTSFLHDQFTKQLASANLIVISDYGKGTVFDPQPYIQQARKVNKPVFVDPKGTDFKRYQGATLLTPNRQEFEMVQGVCHSESDLIEKGQQAIIDYDLQALLITRSEQGMTLIQRDKKALHFSAQAKEVYDVTGAGDTVIGVLAAAFAAENDLMHATQLANVAAGLVVSRLGAASVTPSELQHALEELQGKQSSIVNKQQLLQLVLDAKAKGETIVMTNGCFDILHAGHVGYLQQAKSLGDRLIIAVNDDASVKRLKGNTRPINSLEKRMEVLAALSSVDWIVPFSEDTPEKLITSVLPTILVKGGDYEVNQIAGAKQVIENGGQVKILPFKEGCSTTQMIEKILSAQKSEDKSRETEFC